MTDKYWSIMTWFSAVTSVIETEAEDYVFVVNSSHADNGNKGLALSLYELSNTFVSNIEKHMRGYELPFPGVLC
jgi:hypothetical protein